MKTFTYAHKKWAMASALLLVLGFNVSFNSHNGGVASAELASESDEVITSKITTAKGVADVTYIKAGDKKVLALLPKYVEGKGFCEDCERDQFVLKDIAFDKNTKDIDALNVAVMAKLEEQKAKPVVKADEEKPEEKAKPKAKATFTEKTLKKCGKEKDAESMDCRINEITSVLSDEKANQKEVAEFYGKYVQQQLAQAIASNDSSENQSALDSLTAIQDAMVTEKGWVDLRKRMGLTLAASIGYAGNTVKTFYSNWQTALNTNDLNASNQWMKMYQQGINQVYSAKNNFASMQTGWANQSLSEQSISYADLNGVVWSYSNPADQILNSLISAPQNFNFVNGQLISTGVVTQPGTTLPGQISVPNAGIGTQPQLPGTSVGPTMPGSIDPTLVAPRLAPGRGVGQQTQVVTPTLVPSTALPGATATSNTNGVQYIMVPVGRQ